MRLKNGSAKALYNIVLNKKMLLYDAGRVGKSHPLLVG
jgi:hypothetical protein